ncbi:serine/threonine-protein kinase [Anaeromyxobacter sp. Fw109-5]|uniref:serine/threonine-protein kinase n=1 Tax=Anaeromyxobacter sp. (strain Fw109-5) TaxID=404589 RepID=UPI000158A77B|nr:serine/threonine-protein kinase [Anaeromyxobacter sp. Fw109-5]ABS24337.1 protein kinase [Anaeromyxobacter sp. Fw109-5]
MNFCPACGAPLRAGARRRGGREKDGVVADRYRLVELLGEGGMGRVYRAEHIRMGKALALKLLREDFAREPAAAERFLAEARAVSRLSHPHTIAVFDFGEAGPRGGLYLAMEYVPGEDLAAVLRAGGPLPEARARELGRQILGSLAEAHEAGVVHRDMKPGNVMLMRTRSGEDFAKVLDFGIAALRDDRAAGAGDAIVGTPAYLAPEQARGAAVDGRTDLYALGCVLYELVSGRPPFVAPSPMAVVSAHLSQEPPALAKLVPGVSRAFAEVVHRALAKRPEDRFPSADAMREALVGTSGRAGRRARPGDGERDAGGGLASRADFDALAARILRPGRVVLALAALAVLGGAAVAWRWEDVHALLAARAPALAAALPAALQPAPRLDGAPQGSSHPSPEGEHAVSPVSPSPTPAEEAPPDVEPAGAPQAETPPPAAEAGAAAPDDPSQAAGGAEPDAGAPQREAAPSSEPLAEEPEALGPGARSESGDEALREVVDGEGRFRLSFEPRPEAALPLVAPSPAP